MSTRLELGRAPKARRPRGKGIRPALFYSMFAILFGCNVLTGVALFMSPDIAGLMNGQNEQVFSAYEDRIAQLRVEVDRLHSRQYAQAGNLNLQLQDLTQQQELLLEQHEYVKALAQKAEQLGIEPAPTDTDDTAMLAPHDPVLPTSADDITAAAASVQEMMDESRLALTAISEAATTQTDEIVSALGSVGIRPQMPQDQEDGVGGPFLPASDDADSIGLVDDANAVMNALVRFRAARDALDEAPIHKPLAGELRMSSGFGNRKDPFTGGRAFHAGLDFPEPTGTIVLSAGSGTVTFVGQRSGYGNVVEVDHGNGIVTRYGHLSAFLVKEGQVVDTGTPIANVGSTGRSTGPHLHFEVRIDDQAVDPRTFLNVGKSLERYIATT